MGTSFTSDDLELILARGHETSGVEFKPAGPSDGYLLAQVTRAVLGLANRRDGGYVIVGVSDDEAGVTPVGVNEEDLKTWNFDDVSAKINAFADPSVELSIFTPKRGDRIFVVIQVAEFSAVPVLCRRDWADKKQVLRRGACYVRSVTKPETSEIPTQTEMRELLDIATEKRLRSFFSLSASAGLSVQDLAQAAGAAKFAREPGVPEGPIQADIGTRGRWELRVHPVRYSEERLELDVLRPVMERCSVKVGGWSFPLVAPQPRPVLEANALVQGEFQFQHYKEVWRLSTSGQFCDLMGIAEDWRDESGFWPGEASWKPGARVGLQYLLRTLLQIFEFTSRLATAIPGEDDFKIQVHLYGLKNRELYVDAPGRMPFMPGAHVAAADSWSLSRQVDRATLARDSRTLATEAAKRLFAMFEFRLPTEQLAEVARTILPGPT